MNSDKASSREDYAKALEPDNSGSRFIFAIGGNIISRGVTFQNLLSMFF